MPENLTERLRKHPIIVLLGAAAIALGAAAAVVTILAYLDPDEPPVTPGPSSSSLVAAIDPSGQWKGQWEETSRIDKYEFVLTLAVVGGSKASGKFDWTVVRSSDPREQPGMRAVEELSGDWDAATRTFDLAGRVVHDPDGFLTADDYSLTLSADGRIISGETSTAVGDKKWAGKLRGTRV